MKTFGIVILVAVVVMADAKKHKKSNGKSAIDKMNAAIKGAVKGA